MTETSEHTTARSLTTVRSYLDAWNRHDGQAALATFADDGTYVDPTLPGPIGGQALAGYVDALSTAFPDLRFDVEAMAVDGNRVTAQWRMRGTNTGPLPGAPVPTGGTCDLPGVDVITVGPDGITSVVGYFDQKTFVEQLGLRAVVVPADEPPMVFGMSVRTDLGNTTVPGALSMTWIDVTSPEEEAEVQQRGEEILGALAAEPGFIGWLGTFAGGRGHTVTAWTGPDAAESAIARNVAHQRSVQRWRDNNFAARGFTSIWVPHRLNQQLFSCPACRTTGYLDPGATSARCACGHDVEVSSYL